MPIVNPSYEAVTVAANNTGAFNAAGGAWTLTGFCSINNGSTGYNNGNVSPVGSQHLTLQGFSGTHSVAEQTVTEPAGTYTISLRTLARINANDQSVRVVVNGSLVSTIQPTNHVTWDDRTTAQFTTSAGTFVLRLETSDSSGDRSINIDDVRLNPVGGGTIPGAPTALNITGITTSSATANWTDNSTNETGFKLRVRTVAGPGAFTNITVGADDVSEVMTGLAASTNYECQVAATNATGDSAYTALVPFTTATPVAPPVNSNVTAVADGQSVAIGATIASSVAVTATAQLFTSPGDVAVGTAQAMTITGTGPYTAALSLAAQAPGTYIARTVSNNSGGSDTDNSAAFTIGAIGGGGEGPFSAPTPVITSPAAFSFAENQTLIGTLIFSDSDTASGYTVTATGPDSAAISFAAISGQPLRREIRLASAPNFEAPSDANADGVYTFTITVSDGTNSAQQLVNATVTNVAEGSIVVALPALRQSDWVGSTRQIAVKLTDNGNPVVGASVTASSNFSGITITASATSSGAGVAVFACECTDGGRAVLTFAYQGIESEMLMISRTYG